MEDSAAAVEGPLTLRLHPEPSACPTPCRYPPGSRAIALRLLAARSGRTEHCTARRHGLQCVPGTEPETMQAILVTADADERDILTFVLRHAGLAVSASIDLEHVTATWLERPADLIVVAGETGKGLAKDIAALRGATEVPLILLLDDIGEATHVALVRTGVDLVLMRPVSPLLLAAYAQSLLRRAGAAAAFAV